MPIPAPLYIFDLDGTLADATRRRALLDQSTGKGTTKKADAAAWDAFDAAGCTDEPIPAVTRTLRLLSAAGAEVLVMTGRSAAYRDDTVRWLETRGHRATWLVPGPDGGAGTCRSPPCAAPGRRPG